MEVGAVEVELSFVQKEKLIEVKFGKSFSSLVNPEIEPSQTALSLTGITLEELETAPAWKNVKSDLSKFLGEATLLGQNILFDIEYLKNQNLNLKNPYADTLELALTFLPFLPVHSLEYLASEFGVEEGSSHRALVDAKNSGTVLAGILNEFLGFDSALQKELKGYLEKSVLSFKNLFLDLPEVWIKATSHNSPSSPLILRGEKEPFFEHFLPPWPDKTILTLPLSFKKHQELLAFLASQGGRKMVGISHFTDLDEIAPNQRIVDPDAALCEVRYERIKEAATAPPEISKILIKLAIFRKFYPQSVDLSQLKWAYEEKSLLHLFKVDPDLCPKHSCAYFNFLSFEKEQIYFLELSALFKLVREWHVDFFSFPVLLFELSKIEDELGAVFTESWNLRKIREALEVVYPIVEGRALSFYSRLPKEVEAIANELDLFFGILHLVYLKSEGEFAENLVISEEEREQERFQKLIYPAQKLISKLMALAEYVKSQEDLVEREIGFELSALLQKILNLKNLIREIFLESDEENIYWLRFGSKFVDLNRLPKNLAEVSQEVWKKISSVTIIDSALPQSSQTYFEKRLGLQSFHIEKFAQGADAAKIAVKIFGKSPAPGEFRDFLESLSGNTIVILPSQAKLVEIHELLEKNLGADKKLLTPRSLRNMDKFKNKLLGNQNFIFLLSTNNALRNFKKFPEAQNLIIWKIPFEAPGFKAVLHQNFGEGGFVDYFLPRAVHMLHTLLTRFLAGGGHETKKIYLLDSRVLSGYDQAFRKYLEEFPDFELSTI